MSRRLTFLVNLWIVQLNDSSLLPSQVCGECDEALMSFSKFADDVKKVQLRLGQQLEENAVKIEYMEDEPLEVNRQQEESSVFVDERVTVEALEEVALEQHGEAMDFINSGSDWDDPSDSDYKKRMSKRKKIKKGVQLRRGRSSAKNTAVDRNDDFEHKWCNVKLICNECEGNLEFLGPHQLYKHNEKLHPNVEAYQCPDCESTLHTFQSFLNHYIAEHQRQLRFCCVICSDAFTSYSALIHHLQSSHKKKDQTVIHCCVKCGEYCSDSPELSEHAGQCDAAAEDEGDRKVHHSMTVEKLFADELAANLFETQNLFNIPESEKCEDGSVTGHCQQRFVPNWNGLPMSCLECGAKVQSAHKLSEHFAIEHPESKTKNFVCNDCPEQKNFHNLESFLNHTFIIHHEHLKYYCFVCDAAFWNFKALFLHYKAQHNQVRINICLHDGKLHKSCYDLKCHKEMHAPKVDETGETLLCTYCPKVYQRKAQWLRHIENHKNQKVWICEVSCAIIL